MRNLGPVDDAEDVPRKQDVDAKLSSSDSRLTAQSAATPSVRALGTTFPNPPGTQSAGTALTASSSAHVHSRQTNIVDSEVSASAAIAESKLSLASDAAAGTASRRTLGTGATQAAAGNDARLSDSRTPTDGSVTGPKLANGAVTAEKVGADVATQAELDAVNTAVVQRANHTGTQAQSTVTGLTTDLAKKPNMQVATANGVFAATTGVDIYVIPNASWALPAAAGLPDGTLIFRVAAT